MRKILILGTVCSLILLSGCVQKTNSATAFMMDTVVNIEAVGDKGIIDDTLNYCRTYEKMLSRTDEGSQVYKLNRSGKGEVSDDLALLLAKSIDFSKKTDGKYDVSICSVSSLWDFKGDTLPDANAIKAALNNVGYEKIKLDGNYVDLGGAQIDLGAIAKGYISSKAVDYLKSKGVKTAVVNFGGNVVVMGDDYYNVGIKNPFGDGVSATLKVKNTAVVTSGTYERYITVDGKKYHHIIDTKTGYPVDSDIVSATVICADPTDADALSTCCLVLGLDAAQKFINNTDGVEAIFITTDGEIHISSGIYAEDGYYRL
ncbi:MAG: FAD:protein FMN transferase [Clostridia bacterium]|nr:FAD:protein FMN transferase [Clostridia bacterium]